MRLTLGRAAAGAPLAGASSAGLVLTVVAVVAVSWTGSARAQFGATARVERPLPAGSELDPTSSATELDATERRAASDSVSSLLRESPGTRVTVLGSRGAYSTLSLRGAGAEHTAVLFDLMPIGLEGGAVDLSTLPLAALDRVEVYRGGAPIALGESPIGGVVRLVPRTSHTPRADVHAGGGSFADRAFDVAASTGDASGVGFTGVAGVNGTDGNFDYVADPTPLVPGDEVEVARENGQLDEGFALGHLTADVADGKLSLFALGYGRRGGVPGPAIQPTRFTRRALARYLGGLSFEREEREGDNPWRVRIAAGASYERNQLTDRFGEIGLGRRATDDRALVGNGRASVEASVTEWLGLAAVLGYRGESFAPEDALAQHTVGESIRHVGSIGAEVRLTGAIGEARFEIRPSGRLELSDASLLDIRRATEGVATDAMVLAPSARLGLVVEPWRGVALVGSVATGTRVPTVSELFGDRAFLVGDTTLRPERSVSADLGVMARGRIGWLRGRAELRGFSLFVDDLIRYRRNNQFQAIPENVGQGRIFGGELGVSLHASDVASLSGALTILDPRDVGADRDLPLRPRVALYARPDVHVGPFGVVHRVRAFVDVAHVGESFVDPTNLVQLPARTRFGVGIGLDFLEGRVRLAARVADVFDARGQDLLGFPLPGRSFHVDLAASTEASP